MHSDHTFIYSNRLIYTLLMRLLYGRFFNARYQAISNITPQGADIVDVCSGDCRLYLNFLREKKVKYLGLDYSPHFVKQAKKANVKAKLFNVWKRDIPPADFLIMQASLYQFIPHEKMILEKLLNASKKKVIVAEPIRNLSDSRSVLIARLSRTLTRSKSDCGVYTGKRFNKKKLIKLFHKFDEFQKSFLIPGGREIVGVFRGRLGK
ncbi:class I SAM-dependent methyltransferase [Desulfococcaceae bacterium HSG7]|nr:class I SAM-dependent methyltransferase [Desulfococcaceae bacterium HSG7]